jgi:hypothetical protein
MWFRRRVAGGTRPSGGVSRALVTAILAVGLTTVGVPTKPMVYIDPLASTTGRSEVGPAPPGTKLDCRIDFLPVKPVVGVGSIIGTASAYCSVAPDEHVLTLSLDQLRAGHGWGSVASKPDPTIPRPRATYQVKTVCQPGQWRVTATATGSLWHQSFRFEKHSIERIVSAQDCRRKRCRSLRVPTRRAR